MNTGIESLSRTHIDPMVMLMQTEGTYIIQSNTSPFASYDVGF